MKTLSIIFLIICFAAGYVIGSLLVINRERKIYEFERNYERLQNKIEELPVSIDNFNKLMQEIESLWHLPYVEKEKMQILVQNFYRKFRIIE